MFLFVSDPDSGREGGANAPLNWMKTAIKQQERKGASPEEVGPSADAVERKCEQRLIWCRRRKAPVSSASF